MTHAQGGYIGPPNGPSDTIPVMIHPGEEFMTAEEAKEYVLTDAGWPRPNIGGLPVPWVAPTRNLGEVNEGRKAAGVGGGICQVCGQGWPVGGEAFMWTHLPAGWQGPLRPGDPLPGDETDMYAAFDAAVLHERCAKLTAAMCPHIRENTEIILVSVPANDATPLFDQSRNLLPTYPAGVCIFIERNCA